LAFKRRLLFFNLGLAILFGSLTAFLSYRGFFQRIELAGLDFSFRIRRALPVNPHINIIEITDDDINKTGRWPWPRNWHAAIAQVLTELGAKEIYFDIIFSEPSTESDDKLFEEAIKACKNIYLPFVFQNNLIDEKTALLPIKRFSEYIKGSGAVNIYPDVDGTLRRVPIVFVDKNGHIYPHAALKLALDYAGLEIKEIKPGYVLAGNTQREFKIPVSLNHKMLINWAGRWERTFKHYDFLEVLTAYQDILDRKTPKISREDFKDSICIIGLTAIGLYDIKPIPLQPEYPGIGIMANVLNDILNKNFLFSVPRGINFLLIYLLALSPALLIFGERPFKEGIYTLLIGIAYFLIHFLSFQNNVCLGLASPLIGLFASGIGIGTYNFVRISVERQNFFKLSVIDGLTGLYNIRYFRMLLETELTLTRIDPEKKFAIIMSDVDHFKNFNDTYGHQVGDLVLKEVAATLKSSVRSSDIVARYGGEEMIVLLRGSSSLDETTNIAEKIRKNVENAAVKDQNNTYKITVSFGVSFVKPDDTVESIIKRADDGLYKAKALGRNRVGVMKEDLKSMPPIK